MKATLACGLTERIDVRRELVSCSLYIGFAIEQLSTRSRSTLLLLAADLPKVSSLLAEGAPIQLGSPPRSQPPETARPLTLLPLWSHWSLLISPSPQGHRFLLLSCALRLLHHQSNRQCRRKGPSAVIPSKLVVTVSYSTECTCHVLVIRY